MPRENHKGDSRVANQNPAVPIINQSESDFKRYFGDDPLAKVRQAKYLLRGHVYQDFL